MNKVIKFSEVAGRKIEEPKNNKEEKQMKNSNIIRFSEMAKRNVLRGGSALLMVLAVFFASAPCIGHFYEPEVPQKL